MAAGYVLLAMAVLIFISLEFVRSCFDEMLSLAEALAGDEQFLRVDFYDCGRPVFGEITLHPHAGHGVFDPPHWDAELGKKMSRLPIRRDR